MTPIEVELTNPQGCEKTTEREPTMDAAKRKVLEKAGWKIGDAADILRMSEAERQVLDTRVELALAIRRQREARNLSQKQLAAMLNTSQPRVAKMEQAASDVSMDQLVRAFTVAGGSIVLKAPKAAAKKGRRHPGGSATLVLEIATRGQA